MFRSLLGSSLVVLLLGWSSVSLAQDNGRARVHFQAARAYFEEGAYEQALIEFQQAYRLSPLPALLFNLGTTHERLGHYAQAADSFEQFLAETPDHPDGAQLRSRIEHLRARAEREEGSPAGPDSRDTESAASPPTPESTSAASPPLQPPQSVRETSTAPSTAPGRDEGGSGDGLIIGGAVALGVGGAALVMAVTFGALALASDASIQDGCGATSSCQAEDVQEIRDFALMTDLGWTVAAAGAGVGLVLLILGMEKSGTERATASFAPYATPTGAGMSVRSSF